tara:strand:- start:8362 stop:8580 length:219 start_codon:yes stop_codon:yes gene_type:complete
MSDHLQNPSLVKLKKTNLKGIKVYNFHPVHLFINTQYYTDYLYFKKDKVIIPNENINGIKNVFNAIINSHEI